jgi:transcriptional regulator with XRE-family HTH domain
MPLSDRLRAQMRWRGIKSQNHLSRISGVSQSSIHRLLTRGDSYAASWHTLQRLARALDTSASWLSAGDDPAAGYAAELNALMARLPDSTCRGILALARTLAESAEERDPPAKRCADA